MRHLPFDYASHLPFDYTRCANLTCALRDRCLRAISPGHQTHQWMSEFPGGADCHGFIIDVSTRVDSKSVNKS